MVESKRELEQVIADWRGDAAVLRRRGNSALAEQLEKCADEAWTASERWVTWISEGEAMTRSGHQADWFRARFERWKREGDARQLKRGVRQYRLSAVPRRADVATAAVRGREAARKLKRPA